MRIPSSFVRRPASKPPLPPRPSPAGEEGSVAGAKS